MNETDLRALVRRVIAEHHGARLQDPADADGSPGTGAHPSHALFTLPDGSAVDGPCLIEPAVACNHCGYCRSYGH